MAVNIRWIECTGLFVLLRLCISHIQDGHVLFIEENAQLILSCFNHCVQHVKIDPQVEIFAVDLFDAGYVQSVLAVIATIRSPVFKDAQTVIISVYREDLSAIGRCEQRNDS